tara:strand:- start:1957 stop:2742 length:786 start_codon:yes stop_codon:yes gene_type:complete
VVSNKREKLARFGIATKGFVYCLIGLLTALAAFNLGGDESDSKGALSFLAGQPFGKVLLIITSVGLCGFVFWRLYQTITDHDHKGSDSKGITTRIGFGISALFYGFLAFTAIKMVLGFGSGSGNNQVFNQDILQKTYGQILFFIIGAAFLGKAVFQFYRAYSEKFIEKINMSELNERSKRMLILAGKIGFTARGIVIAIIAFLIFRTAFTANSEGTGGKAEAFQYLQSQFGSLILGVVALGLLIYGLVMFVLARHRELHIG